MFCWLLKIQLCYFSHVLTFLLYYSRNTIITLLDDDFQILIGYFYKYLKINIFSDFYIHNDIMCIIR